MVLGRCSRLCFVYEYVIEAPWLQWMRMIAIILTWALSCHCYERKDVGCIMAVAVIDRPLLIGAWPSITSL